MRTAMHLWASLGLLGAAAAGAYADHDDDKFSLHISIGSGFPWNACAPAPCRPVYYPPVRCEPVRYRRDTVWEDVPRTEVWYDWCGRRHERTVYERVCRTVWVPVYACGHTHYASQSQGGHRRGDDRDYPQTWEPGDERHAGAGGTGEVTPRNRTPAAEPLAPRTEQPAQLPTSDARALHTPSPAGTPTKDATRTPQGGTRDGARSAGKALGHARLADASRR